jgi:hypothetical protein
VVVDDLPRERPRRHEQTLVRDSRSLAGGALFGALSVGIQHGFRRGGDPGVGAFVTAAVALIVAGSALIGAFR